ncbi:GntR family transcriptional regulator [Streptomyces sp. NPDC004111]|uniref:GntR family transcriptional regulator n=1 Tax=Streptomyces sp. NPDC004111 TaxID=3364690 RepID=UPI0036A8E290
MLVPFRRQVIADDLRSQITTGRLQAGERLPSEAQLAARYAVSTPTLRNALALLQAEGLVEKVHGKGNFVGQQRSRVTYLGGGRTLFADLADDPTQRVSIRSSAVQAHGPLPPLLEVPTDSPLMEYLCIRHVGGTPHSLASIYVPQELAPEVTPTEAPSYAELEGQLARCRRVVAIRERVSARLPSPEETAVLRINRSLAVLAIARAAVDGKGRVIAGVLLVLPGDRADAYFITQLTTTGEQTTREQRRQG